MYVSIQILSTRVEDLCCLKIIVNPWESDNAGLMFVCCHGVREKDAVYFCFVGVEFFFPPAF